MMDDEEALRNWLEANQHLSPEELAQAMGLIERTDEEVAESIAKFRMPAGLDWRPLRDDILGVMHQYRKLGESGGRLWVFPGEDEEQAHNENTGL